MRKLIESTYVSLDGRVSGDRFWEAQMQFRDDAHEEHAWKLLEPAEGLVLGRATYDAFSTSWPSMDGRVADRLNALPKHIASRTLTEPVWNSEVLQGDLAEAVAAVKAAGDGTLVKYGTGPVSRALVEAGQLDELHLWVYPFVAGEGEPLLPGTTTTHLALAEVHEVGNGVVVLTYTPRA